MSNESNNRRELDADTLKQEVSRLKHDIEKVQALADHRLDVLRSVRDDVAAMGKLPEGGKISMERAILQDLNKALAEELSAGEALDAANEEAILIDAMEASPLNTTPLNEFLDKQELRAELERSQKLIKDTHEAAINVKAAESKWGILHDVKALRVECEGYAKQVRILLGKERQCNALCAENEELKRKEVDLLMRVELEKAEKERLASEVAELREGDDTEYVLAKINEDLKTELKAWESTAEAHSREVLKLRAENAKMRELLGEVNVWSDKLVAGLNPPNYCPPLERIRSYIDGSPLAGKAFLKENDDARDMAEQPVESVEDAEEREVDGGSTPCGESDSPAKELELKRLSVNAVSEYVTAAIKPFVNALQEQIKDIRQFETSICVANEEFDGRIGATEESLKDLREFEASTYTVSELLVKRIEKLENEAANKTTTIDLDERITALELKDIHAQYEDEGVSERLQALESLTAEMKEAQGWATSTANDLFSSVHSLRVRVDNHGAQIGRNSTRLVKLIRAAVATMDELVELAEQTDDPPDSLLRCHEEAWDAVEALKGDE